jgi:hypothetical protein
MTSTRIKAGRVKTVVRLLLMTALASLSFAACLTPEVVDYKEDKVTASAACLKCIATADTPGPGCGDEIAVCREAPSCGKSLDCSLQNGCIGGEVQRLVACLPACTIAAGLGGPDDPGRSSGIRVFECITHGACASVCFTDGGDGGVFPIDASDGSTPMPDANADSGAGNACLDPADQAAGSDATKVSDAARTCGIQCYGLPDMTCSAKCMETAIGFSAPCAKCWGDSIMCVSDHCLGQCLGGSQDPTCIACSSQYCTPAFHACSGT